MTVVCWLPDERARVFSGQPPGNTQPCSDLITRGRASSRRRLPTLYSVEVGIPVPSQSAFLCISRQASRGSSAASMCSLGWERSPGGQVLLSHPILPLRLSLVSFEMPSAIPAPSPVAFCEGAGDNALPRTHPLGQADGSVFSLVPRSSMPQAAQIVGSVLARRRAAQGANRGGRGASALAGLEADSAGRKLL